MEKFSGSIFCWRENRTAGGKVKGKSDKNAGAAD
jgi:hypothetical protein